MEELQKKIEEIGISLREHKHNVIDSTTPIDIVPIVQYETTGTTITPAVTVTCLDITALASASTIANPRSVGYNFQKLMIRIKDNGTARALTWGSLYVAGGFSLPSTTVAGKYLTLGFQYCTANSLNKWQLIGYAQE